MVFKKIPGRSLGNLRTEMQTDCLHHKINLIFTHSVSIKGFADYSLSFEQRKETHTCLLNVKFHRKREAIQIGDGRHIGLLRYYQVYMRKLHINTQNTLLLILLTVHNHLSKHGTTILTPQSRNDHFFYSVGPLDPVRMLITGTVTLYLLVCLYDHLPTPHCFHYPRL